MNLLGLFLVWLLAILIFLVLYMSYFKKFKQATKNKNSVIEKFGTLNNMPQHCEAASKDIACMYPRKYDNIFYTEDGQDVDECYINITKNNKENKQYNENANTYYLYKLNGTDSYIFIRDYLDNNFSITLLVEFEEFKKPQTLIETKFYKIEMNNNILKLISKDPKNQDTPFDEQNLHNFDKNKMYELTIFQDKKYSKIKLSIETASIKDDKIDLWNVSSREIEVKMDTTQQCDFSLNNDIFIGCGRKVASDTTPKQYTTKEHFNGYIYIKEKAFDKSKYDEYYDDESRTTEFPKKLECDPWCSYPSQAVTTSSLVNNAVIKTGIQSDYVDIIINNIVNDIKIKYKKSKITDINDKDRVPNFQKLNANKFFMLLQYTTELYKHPNILKLEKKDGMFIEGYHNLYDTLNTYISYLFNLKLTDNQAIVETFDFLDMIDVRKFITSYDSVYMFILGERSAKNSHFKFLTLNKPVFMLVFKNNDNIGYEYKTIHINLEIFYKLQQKILNHIISERAGDGTDDDDEYYTSTIKEYLTQTYTIQNKISLNPELANTAETTLNVSNNFYRMYDTDLNLSLSVNVYAEIKLVDLIFVSYYNEIKDKPCGFVASGETLFECKQLCYNGMDNTNCNEVQCNEKCDNCENTGCKWNLIDLERQKFFVPSTIRLKGFAGNKQAKLSWIRPLSKHNIDGYYILVESSLYKKNFDLFVYKGDEELLEYVVNNLKNDMSYTFYILSKNEFGVSDLSNKVTLIPDENKMLHMEDLETQVYTDSINKYYKERDVDPLIIDSKKEIEKITRIMEENELKDIIIDKLLGDGEDRRSYNLNIF